MNAISIPLSEAKANLSSLVKDVRESETYYVITLHGKPAAMVAPLEEDIPKKTSTRGLLAQYADDSIRRKEGSAFASAIVEKHKGQH